MKPSPDKPSALSVSVIIPVFNNSKGLKRCLSALAHQTFPRHEFEVVVVDNGSVPPVEGLDNYFAGARLVVELAHGSYAARNAGINASRGAILAFTDSDCIPDPDWIRNGVRSLLDSPGLEAVTGAIQVFPKVPARPTTVETYESLFGFRQDRYVAQGFGATANLFVRRRVMEEVGVFNSNLLSSGDLEWCDRLRQVGGQLAYVDQAKVQHPARRSLSDLLAKTRRLAGGHYALRLQAGMEPLRLRRAKGPGLERLNSFLRGIWLLRPPLSTMWRAFLASSSLDPRSRFRILGVIVIRRLVYATEWLRLSLGGSPRR